MKKLLATSAVSLFALMGSAHATTLDVLLQGSTPTVSIGPDVPSNIALTDLNAQFIKVNDASLNGGILTVGNGNPPSSLFGYAQYAIVPTSGVPNPNQFGFTWLNPQDGINIQVGTSDKAGGLHSYAIAGNFFSPYIGASPLNILLIDPTAVLTTVQFSSLFGDGITTGFRVTNFSENESPLATPLPGTIGLFLTALAGLLFFGRKMATKPF